MADTAWQQVLARIKRSNPALRDAVAEVARLERKRAREKSPHGYKPHRHMAHRIDWHFLPDGSWRCTRCAPELDTALYLRQGYRPASREMIAFFEERPQCGACAAEGAA